MRRKLSQVISDGTWIPHGMMQVRSAKAQAVCAYPRASGRRSSPWWIGTTTAAHATTAAAANASPVMRYGPSVPQTM